MALDNGFSVSIPKICAPREELLRLFDQCAEKQYIAVHAPAGYGKTVSALLWLKKTNRNFAWLTLDEYDNKIPLFYRSLCQHLLAIVPQNDAVSELIAGPSFSASPVESAMDVLSQLTWPEGKYTLVLDDFHALVNEEIAKSLPFVLKRLPAPANVLLLSRTGLPEAISALNDKTAFISGAELSFTPEEIRKHYAHHGSIITQKEAKNIHSLTDGWVIILNAMARSGNKQPLSDNLSLNDFFEKNIWNSLDEAMRLFLIKTSVVDSFDPELCARLTESGKPECAETLEKLTRENIPLSCLGAEYRLHNLFLEFLRGHLQKSGIAQTKLYDAAASYYLETSQFYKAAFYSWRAENHELRTRVIQTFFKSKNPPLELFLELSTVYDNIPKTVCDNVPILYMPKVLSAFLRGNAETVKQLFDMFYAVLPVLLSTANPLINTLPIRLLLDFRVKLADLPAFMNSLHIKKETNVPGQTAIITLQMPFAHRSVRNFYELLNARARDALHSVYSGILPGDYRLFYKSINAGLLAEQNKPDDAFPAALAAYNAITADTGNEVVFCVSIGLAELYLLKGETEKYRATLGALRRFIDKNKARYLLKNLTAYEARASLWEGDKKTAGEWLKNYFVSGNTFGELYRVYQNFTTVRAYIVSGETSKAMAALEQLKNLGQSMDRPLDAAEAEVLAAIVEWITGKKKKACGRLYGVLAALRPYGFIRIAADEGKAVLPILSAVIKKIEKEPQKDEELFRFIKEVRVAAYEQSMRFPGLTYGLNIKPVILSSKQAFVLELLSQGRSNAEIVKMTGLSLNTIKTHTKIAYQKLEVTNALDAIVEAKRRGIIK